MSPLASGSAFEMTRNPAASATYKTWIGCPSGEIISPRDAAVGVPDGSVSLARVCVPESGVPDVTLRVILGRQVTLGVCVVCSLAVSMVWGTERRQRRPPGPSLERATTSLASLGIQEEKRSFGMEVAQLLISLLHGWGLDPDLDRVCQAKLGLLRPMVPVSFGLLSRGGYMSLFLPTWFPPVVQPVEVAENLPLKEYEVLLAKKTEFFTARGRWELAPAITTHHLLTIVSVSNTLMSMSNATFLGEDQKRARQMTLKDGEAINDNQVKQGWSLLTTLHCILLPDIVAGKYKRIRVEMLARRWQDRCLEVREGAQALLLAELNRIGPKGRKALVEAWAPFLPTFSEIVSSSSAHQAHGVGSQNPTAAYSHGAPQYHGHHGQ
ncbi:unnamed protein product, partial [Notodromas monacha]